MGIEAIAIGAFLFVAIVVAGWRALSVKPEAEKPEVISTAYTGPTYSAWGGERG